MFDWMFGKKESEEPSDEKKEFAREMERLREEYGAIPNNTTSIDEGLRRFQLSNEMVAVADQYSAGLGGGFSGEIICDYDYAITQIIGRLWDILTFKMTAYENEMQELEIKARALLDWRANNYQRWWSDEQAPFLHDQSRYEIQQLIAEIEKAQVR